MQITVPRQKPLLTQKEQSSHLTFAIKHLDYSQDFWKNILCTDDTNGKLYARGGSCYIWFRTTTAFKIIILKVEQDHWFGHGLAQFFSNFLH